MKKYLVEFIGTTLLILTIGACVLTPPGTGLIAPLAIAAVLMVMVYAGGHISGAHYNPAVTLAITLRGESTWAEASKYMAAQFLGALVATVLVKALGFVEPEMSASHPMWPSVLAEFLFTFALVWVVLNVATAKGTTGNSFYGLAIGFTVLAGAYAVGPISGGTFNPAVALALCTLKITDCGDLLMYFIGDFAGAAVAAFAFKYCNDV